MRLSMHVLACRWWMALHLHALFLFRRRRTRVREVVGNIFEAVARPHAGHLILPSRWDCGLIRDQTSPLTTVV
jgi:hypothetical protein